MGGEILRSIAIGKYFGISSIEINPEQTAV